MKKSIVIGFIAFVCVLAVSCGESNTNSGTKVPLGEGSSKPESRNPSYDPKRGEGKFTKVDVGATLDAAMATKD